MSATWPSRWHRLGHSTVKASLIYQGIVNGRDAEIAAALSALATGVVEGG